ncbi:mitochondrial carrier [Ceraceosorus guamensis]|uniref:Mitochondrial carrier n=1 Tax=Ceraceosorus guamensis TaxID=1522189 RepID=A0A316VNJ5_9BASI|nr:mitochondrial carrier [Ceraceosorus guamensis]PWN38890.1 mitochondrial carrier [Ceraceosorus guamensis]
MTSSELPPFAQATAGSLGSAVSGSIVYPLDLISTRIQTRGAGAGAGAGAAANKNGFSRLADALRDVVDKKGVAGLYQGWSSDTISSMLSNFLFFFFRSFLIERALAYKSRSRSAPSASSSSSSSSPSSQKAAAPTITSSQDLAIGFLAGVASRFFTTPLSNVTVRLQTSSESPSNGAADSRGHKQKQESDSESEDEGNYADGPGIVTTLKDIVEEKGALGLWSGFETAILLSSQPAITFYVSSLLSRVLIPRSSRDKPTATQVFFVNALGSTASTLALYPLILSKSRLMWRSPSGRRQYRNLLDVIRKTVRRSGVKGLYQGWESQITKGLFNHGLTMLVKSRVETLFVMLYILLRNRARASSSTSAGAVASR